MKHTSFHVIVFVALSLFRGASSTSSQAKKARAYAEASYEDAGEVLSDLAIPNQPSPTMRSAQGRQSFLATSSQQQDASSELLVRFSQAVQSNSQALMALESQ